MTLLGQPAGELADGGGFAGAIHADDQNDERLAALVNDQRARTGRRISTIAVAQGDDQRRDIRELVARDALLQARQDVLGRLDADIGSEQPGLELLQDLRIDLAALGTRSARS